MEIKFWRAEISKFSKASGGFAPEPPFSYLSHLLLAVYVYQCYLFMFIVRSCICGCPLSLTISIYQPMSNTLTEGSLRIREFYTNFNTPFFIFHGNGKLVWKLVWKNNPHLYYFFRKQSFVFESTWSIKFRLW